MTPPAVTPAGRAATKKRSTASQGSGARPSRPAQPAGVPGHRRGITQRPAPKPPRRVSGPVRGRLAEEVVLPKPQPTRTKRRSAPPRTRTRPRPSTPLRVRVAAFVRALPDHPLLDRLIRGRVWIPLLGVMLAGIVAMQVEVLKLGTSIGRSIERSATLQTRNDQLRMTVAALDGDQRIERQAEARGLIMPAPETIGFLSAHGGAGVGQALANVHTPDATSFLSQTTANGGIATLAASSGSSTDTSSTASTSTATTAQDTSTTPAIAGDSSSSGGAGTAVGG